MNDREIKYLLTGDASKLKSELAAVQKQAEDAGRNIDRALTNAFKGAATRMTAEFAKNVETLNKGLNNIQKGTQNAFNSQSIAQYAKGQSAVAAQLQRMEQQYRTLDRTAAAYRRTLISTGADAATAGSITTNWVNQQRQALQESGRIAASTLGQQFGGIGTIAPTLAAGIKQVDDDAAAMNRELNKAEKITTQWGKSLKTIFPKAVSNDISQGSRAVIQFGQSIGNAAQDLTRLGFGIVAAFAAFATIPLLKTITQIEQAQLGLESLLDSAEEAGAAIYRIYQFANQTAFPTSDLIAYEQKLVSVGLSGEQAFGVIARVSDIGGAFGATGDQLDRFYYVLSQIFGAGRAMGQDFLQIQNSLPGFISAIGQAMGKSAGEVREAFGDGSVTSQVIADALNILTEEGGKAFQGAIRQSSTLAGMMNNLVDNAKRVGMAFFGVKITLDGMKPSVDGIYARLKSLMGLLLDFAENPLTLRAFEMLGDAMGSVLDVLQKFPQIIGVASGLFIAFATDLITRIPFIGNLIGGIGYGTGLVLGVFIAMVTASKQLQQALVTVAAQFVNFLTQNAPLFMSLLNNFKTLLATLAQGVAPAMIILTQIFLNFALVVLNVINFFIAMGNAIATFLGPELTRAITLTFAFTMVALALVPTILKVIGAIAMAKAAFASLAFQISLVIALIILIAGVLGGFFGKTRASVDSFSLLNDLFADVGGSAGDATDGIKSTGKALDKTGKAAKKATAQLAAFDKMNVIHSPTSSDSDKGIGSPGDITGLEPPKISAPDMSGLKDKFKKAFDEINDMIPEIKWTDLVVPAAVLLGLLALSIAVQAIGWKKAMDGVVGFMGKLGGLFKAIPLWGFGLAAALVLIIVAIFNWDKIEPVVTKVFDNIMKFIGDFAAKLPVVMPKIIASISDAFQRIGENAPKFFAAFGTILTTLGSAVASAMPMIFEAGGKLIGALVDGISKMSPGAQQSGLTIMASVSAGLIKALPTLAQAAAKLITTLAESIGKFLQPLATAALGIITAIGNAIISALPTIVTVVVGLVLLIVNTLVQNLPMLVQAGITLIMSLINGIITMLPFIIEAAVILMSTLITAIVDSLPTLIGGAILIVVSIVKAIIDNLPMIIQAIVTVIITLVKAIIDNLPKIIEGVVTLMITLVTAIIDNLPMVIDATVQLITTLVDALIDNLPAIINGAILLITTIATALINNLPTIITAGLRLIIALAKALIDNLPQIISAAIRLIVALATALWDNRQRILTEIGKIGGKIIAKLGEIDWGQAGKDLVVGLWNGINNMGSWIGEKIKGFGKGVTDSLKKFFGIQSPSRLMRDEIGKMLGEGVGVGIELSTGDAVSEAKTSAASISNALTAFDMGSIASASGQYIDRVSDAISRSSGMFSDQFKDPTLAMTSTIENDTTSQNNSEWMISEFTRQISRLADDKKSSVNVYLDGNKVGGVISDSINDRSMVTGVNQIYV